MTDELILDAIRQARSAPLILSKPLQVQSENRHARVFARNHALRSFAPLMITSFRFGLVTFLLLAVSAFATAASAQGPNIIFLLADDLGYGDIGAFGQQKISTPNLDKLATEGIKLTMHYAGHNVCAPSRCALMSGRHPGHGYIRNNRGGIGMVGGPDEGQEPVPAGELKLPLTLKKIGYTLGGYGKWGLGALGSSGDPFKQGFDHFSGYNDQAHAHNYYTT